MADQFGSLIGTLMKPVGFRGEMQMRGSSQFSENIEPGDPLFIVIDGQRIPFFVEDFYETSVSGRSVIKFEFINSDSEAQRFVSCNVYRESLGNIKVLQKEDPSSLIGFNVKDMKSGREGVVKEYLESASNPILVLIMEKREVLLPLNADYLLRIDTTDRQILVDFPDGLIDLQ